MIVRKINKIYGVGIFKHFEWDVNLPEFGDFNLFYGWNYSGKTTLSRIFETLNKPGKTPQLDGSFEIVDGEGRTLRSADIVSSANCRVFNRPFIERNFQEENNAPAVFVVGDDANRIRSMIIRLRQHKDRVANIKLNLESEKSEWERRVNDGLKRNEARGIGELVSDRNFDRRNLDELLEQIKPSPANYILEEPEVAPLISTANSTDTYVAQNLFKIPNVDISEITEGVAELLGQTASNNAINKLKEDPKLEAWVRRGRELHPEMDECEFCGNRISQDRIDLLKEHFSTEYETLFKSVQEKANELNRLDLEVSLPNVNQLISSVRAAYSEAISPIEHQAEGIKGIVSMLVGLLDEKLTSIEKSKGLSEEVGEKVSELIPHSFTEKYASINEILMDHNSQISDLEATKRQAHDKLKKHVAARFYCDNNIKAEEEEYEKITERIGRAIKIQNSIDEKIAKQESEIKTHSVAVGKLNEFINIMLSGSNISAVQLTENEFEFRRGTEKAINMSDGERTAIAFAYFLLTLEESGNVLGETIVFVDDPISSLDSNHIYAIYALIMEKLKGRCKQLFVSTHNYEFLNLLKDEALNDKRNFRAGCSGYLAQRAINNDGEPYAELIKMPKSLRKYKSEYQFVFSLLYQFASSADTSLHEAYTSPTILRKFLEAYLGFRKPAGGSWSNKLDLLFDDKAERREVAKFADDASHMQSIRQTVEHAEYIASAKEMVNKVIDAIGQKDAMHLDDLRSIVEE